MRTAETGLIISELISASQEARIKPGFFMGVCVVERALYRDFLLVFCSTSSYAQGRYDRRSAWMNCATRPKFASGLRFMGSGLVCRLILPASVSRTCP